MIFFILNRYRYVHSGCNFTHDTSSIVCKHYFYWDSLNYFDKISSWIINEAKAKIQDPVETAVFPILPSYVFSWKASTVVQQNQRAYYSFEFL